MMLLVHAYNITVLFTDDFNTSLEPVVQLLPNRFIVSIAVGEL